MLTAYNRESERDQRIVVTGLGVVSPLGIGVERFWDRLMTSNRPESCTQILAERRTGPAESEDADGLAHRPGQIEEFSGRTADFGELPAKSRKQLAKSLKVMNRETQLGVAAGLQAFRDSDFAEAYSSEEIGISFGAGNACVAPEDFRAGVEACSDGAGGVDLSKWGAHGMEEMAPLWLLRCLPNMAACHLAILANLRGPSNTITQRGLGVDLALSEACRILRSGDAAAMLVGGAGTTLSGLNRLHAVWSRTDAEEDGPEGTVSGDDFFPAEGAGAVVLESLESARRRGATIYGEVLASVSLSGGNPRTGGRAHTIAAHSAEEALRRSRLSWSDVGHLHIPGYDPVSAGTTGNFGIDSRLTETGRKLPVVSGRDRWGDGGAGSTAIELVASLLALHNGALFASPPSSASIPDSGLSLVTMAGEAAGENCLKFNRLGSRQATCVALARASA